MRRAALILALVLITSAIIHDICEFVAVNDGIRYFSSEPQRLLYVVLLSLLGGGVAYGIGRLSSNSQRTLKLAALGTFGTVLLVVLSLFAYLLARFAPMVSEAGMWGWVTAAFLSCSFIVVVVWVEFRKAWRRT